MEADKVKHLEFIQNVITRMNTNSFQIKGMSITIIAAFCAVYAAKPNVIFIFISIIPTLMFWTLDAYYLQQERKFRFIYDNVCGLKALMTVPLFSMPIDKIKEIINLDKETKKKLRYCNAFWSESICNIYLSLILLLAIVGFIISLIK